MNQYLEKWYAWLHEPSWLTHPLSVVGIAILITYSCHLFYRKFQPKILQKGNVIISTLLASIHWPLIMFVWIEAIASILRAFTPKLDDTQIHFAWKLREVGLILLLTWVFMRFIRLFEKQLLLGKLTQSNPDKTTVQATGKLLRVVAIIIVVLCIMPVLGIPVSGIVAFGGGSAIVVGIGAQQVLANYFGGLIIYSDQHFRVGDLIYSPDKEIEGKVEYIGWRATQIRTIDKRPLYVPNAAFSSIIVVNTSRMTHRMIKGTICIRYSDAHALEAITQDIRAMLQAHPEIDQRQPIEVHLVEFGPHSLNLEINAFTKVKESKAYRDVRQDVFLKVIQIVEQQGAAFAFPTSTVYWHTPKQAS